MTRLQWAIRRSNKAKTDAQTETCPPYLRRLTPTNVSRSSAIVALISSSNSMIASYSGSFLHAGRSSRLKISSLPRLGKDK